MHFVIFSGIVAQVVLPGESVVPEYGVTDVIAPSMLRVACWQEAIGRLGRESHPVRFYVTPMLDDRTEMSPEVREGFAFGWFARDLVDMDRSLVRHQSRNSVTLC